MQTARTFDPGFLLVALELFLFQVLLMPQDPIILEEHSPLWAEEFSEIGMRLRSALEDTALRIDHVGSTAIEALVAKPVIDIQISVTALEPIDPYRMALEGLGYRWRQDNPEKTKRYFRETGTMRRTHIHVRPAGSWHEQSVLLFREFLRHDDSARKRYGTEKQGLAEAFPTSRTAYMEWKSPIIWQLLQEADQWAKDVGWTAPPSDA